MIIILIIITIIIIIIFFFFFITITITIIIASWLARTLVASPGKPQGLAVVLGGWDYQCYTYHLVG